jgi:hypothetical protein
MNNSDPHYQSNTPHHERLKDFYFLPQILGYSYKPTSHRPRQLYGPMRLYNQKGMSWQRRFTREPVDPETLEPEKTDYTNRELEDYADAILRKDAKEGNPANGENPILFEEHLYNRRRREILVTSGTPDDIQGLDDERGIHRGDGQKIFNRTHPQGRKVNSEHQRKKNGASYYR